MENEDDDDDDDENYVFVLLKYILLYNSTKRIKLYF